MAMILSLNEITLLGGVGKVPSVKEYESGVGVYKKVMRFPLATTSGFYDQNGKKQHIIQWHNIVSKSERVIKNLKNNLVPGTQLYIKGTIKYTRWMSKQTGEYRYGTEIHIHSYQFAGGPKIEDNTSPNGVEVKETTEEYDKFEKSLENEEQFDPSTIMDDDLPY